MVPKHEARVGLSPIARDIIPFRYIADFRGHDGGRQPVVEWALGWGRVSTSERGEDS